MRTEEPRFFPNSRDERKRTRGALRRFHVMVDNERPDEQTGRIRRPVPPCLLAVRDTGVVEHAAQ